MSSLRISAFSPLLRRDCARLSAVAATPRFTGLAQSEAVVNDRVATAVTTGIPDVPVSVNTPRRATNHSRDGASCLTSLALIVAVVATKASTALRVGSIGTVTSNTRLEMFGPLSVSAIRKSLDVVKRGMSRWRHDFKVLETVVCLVSVLVMNGLIRLQASPKVTFHHPSVLRDPSTRVEEFSDQADIPSLNHVSMRWGRNHVIDHIKVATPEGYQDG